MPTTPRRPLYPDYQEPRLHRAGIALRRGYGLGPAESREEQRLLRVLEGEQAMIADPDGEAVTAFQPKPGPAGG